MLSSPCYHPHVIIPMISSHVIILCYQPMLSSHVFISSYHLRSKQLPFLLFLKTWVTLQRGGSNILLYTMYTGAIFFVRSPQRLLIPNKSLLRSRSRGGVGEGAISKCKNFLIWQSYIILPFRSRSWSRIKIMRFSNTGRNCFTVLFSA
jgi:hypothetical protein